MSLLKPALYRDGKWQNPVPTSMASARILLAALKKSITNKAEAVPKKALGPFKTDPAVFREPPASGLRLTLLGHSSVLVEQDGTTVLIDPVFSQRASMVQWMGPKRFFAPPLAIADLPALDAVLLTHDHYDHLDSVALQQLEERKPLFICSTGLEMHLKRWGVGTGRIQAMNWMDTFQVPSASTTPLTLTALPARHFSGRSLKRFGTLWSSFVLRTDRHNLYHGADSGYYEGFQQIGTRFGPFDLALLEIGAFDPLWNEIHLGPDNALQAAFDLRAKVMMPIHWGLFNLAFHAWDQPPERMTQIAAEAGLPLFVPEPGVSAEFTGEAANSLWWRRFQSQGHSVLQGSAASVTTAALRD